VNKSITPADVPEIRVQRGEVYSNAADKGVSDTCACWGAPALRAVRKMLRCKKPIVCRDLTAKAGVVAVGLKLLYEGVEVTPLKDITLKP
jgi:hypothetical protein